MRAEGRGQRTLFALALLPFTSHPFWRRRDRRLRCRTRVRAAGTFETTDGADGHVVIAEDLAREPDAGQPALGEPLLFRRGVTGRLSLDELHAACRAAGISSARVQDIDLRVLLDCEHEALFCGHVERAVSVDRQFWHVLLYAAVPCLLRRSDQRDSLQGRV